MKSPSVDKEIQFINPFVDIKTTDWFYNDVLEIAKKGIINGNESGYVLPSNNASRAEAAAMLIRYLNKFSK